MHLAILQVIDLRRVGIGALLVGITLVAVACSSSTPTRSLESPTLSALAQQSLVPTIPPTATGPAGATATLALLPTVGTPGAPVTTTDAQTRTVAAPSRTPKPAASAPAVAPKPAGLSGKLAYDVYRGADFKLRTIEFATVASSGGAQILTGASWPAYSPDGSRIAYFNWAGGAGLYIANSDGGGSIGPLVIGPGICCFNWSRDGKYVVYANSPKPNSLSQPQPGGPISMIRVDVAFNPNSPAITPLNVSGNGPAFSPDGKEIVYSGTLPNTNTSGLFVSPTNGNGTVRVLTRDNGGSASWSPDGKRIVFQATDDGGNRQVYVINADGSGARKQLTNGKSNDGAPAWSHDGGSIFWRSDQNGTQWAIYVMNADGSNPRKLIANAPADPNLWGWEPITVAP
jgi:dipeptidyl aminopeptidase/acylaminoacyl peptidase